MKKRILAFLLAFALLLTTLPVAVTAQELAALAPDETLGGVGVSHPYGGSGMSKPSASFQIDSSVDYCAILGITKETAEAFGKTVRDSLLAYDLDVNVRSFGIFLDKSYRMENAFCAMLEHEVLYSYDMFMFGSTYYQWYSSGNLVTRLVFDQNDLVYSYADYYTRLNAVNMIAEHLMENVKDNPALSDLQKALVLHDRLANWTSYDYDNQQRNTCPPESYTVVGVLWDRVGVCQGYAEAYAYMLDQCGIPNRFAQSNDLNHIWNIVTIDDQEYYVDVTWDDPVVDRLGQVCHDNFLVSLDKLRVKHDAYDYVTIQNDGRYDQAFWVDSYAAFQLVGNTDLYYLDNVVSDNARFAELCRWSGGRQTTLWRFNDNEAMKWLNEEGRIYSKNYSTLNNWDGTLYVTTAKTIYAYNPATNFLQMAYIPSLPSTNARIFGATIREGRLFMELTAGLPQTDSQRKPTIQYHDLRKIQSIKVEATPTKYTYLTGDNYDFRGLTLRITYTNGSSALLKNVVHGWNAYSSSTTGTKQVTLRLFDQSTTFNLSVIDPLKTPSVTVKNADNGIQVSWGKVKNATKYIVYRSVKSGDTWSEWTRYKTTTATSYTNTNPKNGKTYRYAVRAYCQDIKSNLGKSDSLRRLTTPQVKVVNAKTGTYLSWSSVTGANKFLVYRCYKKNGKWTEWKRIGTTTAKTYTDKTAKADTAYRYIVKATYGDSKSASGYSDEIRRLTPATTTAKKSGSTIKLSWKSVAGAKKYVVYRRVAGSGSWVKLTTTTSRAYTDKTAKKGVYYEYSVRAVSATGCSAHNPCKKIKR